MLRTRVVNIQENYSQWDERIPSKMQEKIYFRARQIQYFFNPARVIPSCASSLFMNMFQTNPLRTFSAISSVIPVSMPMTSLSYHFVNGLKAFTNPYLVKAYG